HTLSYSLPLHDALPIYAVVNLAGASIADGRWTTQRKELLCSSRIETTRALVGALAKMNARPSVLVSASAIGYYGDRGDETLTEEDRKSTRLNSSHVAIS